MSQDVDAKISRMNLMFAPILDLMRDGSDEVSALYPTGPYGEAPSLHRAFVKFAMRAILSRYRQNHGWLDQLSTHDSTSPPEATVPLDIEGWTSLSLEPWAIPTAEDITTSSATWATMSWTADLADSLASNFATPPLQSQSRPSAPCYLDAELRTADASRAVAVWIAEALALEPAGVPAGSFRLVFQGDLRCSDIFQAALQRDAAWQMAIEEGFRRNIILAESWARKRGNPLNHRDRNGDDLNNWYMYECFPQAMRDITAGTSVISCDGFEPGNLDGEYVEALIHKNRLDVRSMEAWLGGPRRGEF